MTIIRRIGAVALAAPLAMSFPVLAALPAQAASTSVITPADGAVITSGSQLTAKAHFDFAVTMQLRVDGPGIGDMFLAEKGFSGDMAGTFPITRNGSYKVSLKGKQTGHIYDSNTFTVRIAPAAPTGVSANVSGGKLVVKWNRGLEDDLIGYVLSGSGVKSRSGSVGSLCQGTNCSTTLSLTRSSGAVSVGVRASRSNGTGGSLYSGTSSATANVGGVSGTLPGGGSAPSLPSNSSVPSANTPLTPFNNESPVTLPSVQPDGATPGFTYPAPQIATDSPKAQNVAATDRLQWGKSVGIALILLIVAAHLGTWTRRLRVAQAGTSSNGMAARIARSGTGRKRVRKAQEQIARAEAIAKTGPVLSGIKQSKSAGKSASKTKPVRRPATLGGKASGGVNVRLAKSTPENNKPKRGHRRK
ncbi:hypothetical protein [Actinomadura bangladeshensis]|uniref:Fibronectin type III domain-containing protein n=1 Tax=Actinomadura bangladeshensis TaxID=453573 RepID=A0A6L9QK16_9ACTN|nr:hypothetical protein [Actinomadura bangladeshensis]NEA25472.1 hypothetical protein [Actinomadura bangladeshensis]NEA28187.1 hypothetical protein [Actinomadura bangladeshensis]